ncbi:hypothetical protein PF002_g19951 [Phytophthora fragariae]|uniref:Uncharacterized protein n=1 Tax=Phytophthora fragariae TaxID=53985 RepID=A0A6A3JIY0_9STRA|nr:hypothetical protein PF003_g36164 [Phytophthora fragariae]KAE8994870.1 hypothetical protein PF011_g16563 [Phytophthora fragariae]KAE9103370.1 hypothetical protein PF007_g14428 [Phytophthora fragariae]KAE9206643.1 hypothetical protein PF002_g19951 [Phytophthora fragariae]
MFTLNLGGVRGVGDATLPMRCPVHDQILIQLVMTQTLMQRVSFSYLTHSRY